jgi:prephenate dehydrogenase
MNVTIVGLGLLGGSFALALRAGRPELRVVGVDSDPAHAEEALRLGIVAETAPLDHAVADADLVVLAVPVSAIEPLLPAVLDRLKPAGVVADFGSTKERICGRVESHPRRDRFVAAHPIAGTEYSGPGAAFAELLRDRVMIVCERHRSAPDALESFGRVCETVGMRLHFMEPVEHDRHLAYVSHLSHVSAFAFGLTVLHKAQAETDLFHLAGSGFGSAARLAKSSPAMWAPIFTQNAANVVEALDDYIAQLQRFRDAVARGDEAATAAMMARANQIRRVLEEIETR